MIVARIATQAASIATGSDTESAGRVETQVLKVSTSLIANGRPFAAFAAAHRSCSISVAAGTASSI